MMTLEEVAKYLRLHRTTVYRLARESVIPGFKIGSQWRFNKTRVDQWMARQEAGFEGPERNYPGSPRRGPALVSTKEGEEDEPRGI
jgi:excisionase family DNA binding protein